VALIDVTVLSVRLGLLCQTSMWAHKHLCNDFLSYHAWIWGRAADRTETTRLHSVCYWSDAFKTSPMTLMSTRPDDLLKIVIDTMILMPLLV